MLLKRRPSVNVQLRTEGYFWELFSKVIPVIDQAGVMALQDTRSTSQ